MTMTVVLDDVELGYEVSGPEGGTPVVAVHGWPDAVHCWDGVLPALHDAGCRVVRPWLRGFGPSRLRDGAPRVGQVTALARDVHRLIEHLDLSGVVLAGHDWGARAGYALAALQPERLSAFLAMSVGYGGAGPDVAVSPAQAHAYWYQWSFATAYGRRRLEADRRAICRYLWETWAPDWDIDDADFDRTAAAFDNPDWADVTIHSYCQRWGHLPGDPSLEEDERRLAATPPIAVPTLVLHGEHDGASLVGSSDGKDGLFSGYYERRTLPGVGHFVPREAPAVVSAAILELAGRG